MALRKSVEVNALRSIALTTDEIDLMTAEGSVLANRKIQCSTVDEKPVVYTWQGKAYSATPLRVVQDTPAWAALYLPPGTPCLWPHTRQGETIRIDTRNNSFVSRA